MSTYTVMNISLMNHDTHREAKCINNNVFLQLFKHALQFPFVEVVNYICSGIRFTCSGALSGQISLIKKMVNKNISAYE